MTRLRISPLAPAAAALLFALGLLGPGCGGGCESCDLVTVGGVTPVYVPDFMLADVNPNSTTYTVAISPRRYLGEVSAWYFGYAT